MSQGHPTQHDMDMSEHNPASKNRIESRLDTIAVLLRCIDNYGYFDMKKPIKALESRNTEGLK